MNYAKNFFITLLFLQVGFIVFYSFVSDEFNFLRNSQIWAVSDGEVNSSVKFSNQNNRGKFKSIYQWEDSTGHVHYTDIPPKYKENSGGLIEIVGNNRFTIIK